MRGCIVLNKAVCFFPKKTDFPASRPSRRWAKRISHHSPLPRTKGKLKQRQPLLIDTYGKFIQTFGQIRPQGKRLVTYGWEIDLVKVMSEELRSEIDKDIFEKLIAGVTPAPKFASISELLGDSAIPRARWGHG